MSKLSERLKRCLEFNGCDNCEHVNDKGVLSCEELIKEVHEKLKYYEDLLPCKVGDILYEPFEDGVIEKRVVDSIEISADGVSIYAKDGNRYETYCAEDFNEFVFLTENEAKEVWKKEGEKG